MARAVAPEPACVQLYFLHTGSDAVRASRRGSGRMRQAASLTDLRDREAPPARAARLARACLAWGTPRYWGTVTVHLYRYIGRISIFDRYSVYISQLPKLDLQILDLLFLQ